MQPFRRFRQVNDDHYQIYQELTYFWKLLYMPPLDDQTWGSRFDHLLSTLYNSLLELIHHVDRKGVELSSGVCIHRIL